MTEGFRVGTWFAKHLEDAIEFGGSYVFEVALDYSPVKDGNWQMRIPDPIPTSAIIQLARHERFVLQDFTDRRRAIFEANKASTQKAE